MKQVVAAIIVREETILICQRTKDQPLPLKWEFPGGKIEPNEQPVEALRRELEEELGIHATIGPKVTTIQHNYGKNNAVELHFYRVQKFEGEIVNRIFNDVRWVDRRDLPKFDFLEADVELVKDLASSSFFHSPERSEGPL
jgi:8-oxo-dGTP diphosphatase